MKRPLIYVTLFGLILGFILGVLSGIILGAQLAPTPQVYVDCAKGVDFD